MTASTAQLDSAQLGIRLLLANYCDVVTRRAWDEMPLLFEEEALVLLETKLTEPLTFRGGAEIGAFIGNSLKEFAFFEIVPLNSVAVVDGGTASGRFYIQEIRLGVASGQLTYAFGLYTDEYVHRGDSWLFAKRSYRSLARTGADLQVVHDLANQR